MLDRKEERENWLVGKLFFFSDNSTGLSMEISGIDVTKAGEIEETQSLEVLNGNCISLS